MRTFVICAVIIATLCGSASLLGETTYRGEWLNWPGGLAYDLSVLSDSGIAYGNYYYQQVSYLLVIDTRSKDYRTIQVGGGGIDVLDVNSNEQLLVRQSDRMYLWRVGEPLVPMPQYAWRTNVHGDTILNQDGGCYYWTAGAGAVELPLPPFRDSISGTALNDLGQIVGQTYAYNGECLAFLWDPTGGLRDLPLPFGYDGSYASDINNNGTIVGHYYCHSPIAGGQDWRRGFLIGGAGVHDFGREVVPWMITDSGYVLLTDRTSTRVWDSEHGSLELPVPAGYTTATYSWINNRGDVLGTCGNYPFIWLRTLPIPTEPAVLDGGKFTDDLTALFASWSSTVEEGQITEFQYAVSRSASDPGQGAVVGWTSAGTAESITITGLTLEPGTTYYVHVKAKNTEDNWSEIGSSDGIVAVNQICETPGEAKLQPDGKVVALTGVVTTYSSGQVAYVEDTARSSGISVQGNVPAVNSLVTTFGKLTTTLDGERAIMLDGCTVSGTVSPLTPYALTLRDAISKPLAFDPATGAGQRGLTDPAPYGLSTVGLLVRLTATVTDKDENFVFLNDGSFMYSTGVRVLRGYEPADLTVGATVAVVGVSSMRKSGSVYQFLLKPRDTGDWQLLN